MAHHDGPFVQAFGLGGADVVLRQHVEQRVFGQFHHHGQGADAQGDGRQDEVLEVKVLPGAVIVHRVQAAEHTESREVGQQESEHPREEDGREEGGHRHSQQGEDQRHVVEPSVFVQGAEDADDNAHDEGEEDGDEGQEHRLGEGLGDNLAHGALALVGAAQVGGLQHNGGLAQRQYLHIVVIVVVKIKE